MNEALSFGLAWIAGIGLGVLFFGGLWWTIYKGVSSRHPARWFIGSMLLRTGITLAGLYFVAGGQWPRLLLCLLGIVTARLLVTRFTKPLEKSICLEKEAAHAPDSR